MAQDHPEALKQFGIRLHPDVMEMISKIQQFRQRTNQPLTLSSIVEDAVEWYYARLLEEGAIEEEK
jgi:hypothetical protein